MWMKKTEVDLLAANLSFSNSSIYDNIVSAIFQSNTILKSQTPYNFKQMQDARKTIFTAELIMFSTIAE